MASFIYNIGINFKSAPLERVAQVQWTEPEGIATFLEHVCTTYQLEEAFFLQTCNRREFYFYAPELNLDTEIFLARFVEQLGISLDRSLEADDFYLNRNEEAALHLFRVASSLDSMVLGETEIMRQLKDQMERGRKHGRLGRRLRSLMDSALWSARQVRTKTKITNNVVSMASLIYRKVTQTRVKRLVIVGAGHYVQSIMPTFSKEKDLDLIFVNRTCPTELAAQYGGKAMDLASFLAEPVPFDAMITATGAPHAIFSKEWLASRQHPMLVLDAALPRDVAQDADNLPNVTVLDLAKMEETLACNRAAREAEIPKTQPYFEEGLERLKAAWLECELAGYSREISSHFQETGAKALDHLMREHLSNLPQDQAEIIRDWTQALVGKLTNIPILGLKGVARDIGGTAVDAFTRQVAEKSALFKGIELPEREPEIRCS